MTGKRTIEEAVVSAAKRVDSEPATDSEKAPRRPKRKVAVLVGYCGTGYHGMQLNPPHRTIEGDLFQAFVKAGAVSQDNSNDPKKSSFLRAARTDKGVHAAGNVVSLKMIVEDEDIVERINSHLPEQIRVWGYVRTNKSFECRKMCSSRIYEYILPTYALMSAKPSSALGQRLANVKQVEPQALKDEAAKFWQGMEDAYAAEGISAEDLVRIEKEAAEEAAKTKVQQDGTARNLKLDEEATEETPERKRVKAIANNYRRAYRAIPERIEQFREALKEYEGVHNFHNYTVGKGFKEASSTRVMKSLTVSDPMVINGTEWVSIKIHGQSFMLHQIRKMIAMAVLVVRCGVDKSKISDLFKDVKVGIPKAPALGLLLEQPVYDGFNSRLSRLGRDSVTFDPYEKEIDAFKHKFIYDRIYTQEAKENEFHAFFAFIDTYRVSELLDYLTDTKSERVNAEPLDDEDELAAEDNEG